MKRIRTTIVKGAAAGVAAAALQAALGKLEELLLLPPGEDADLAPILVDRLARRAGYGTSPAERWTAGTLFHFGYGAFWGAAYAVAREQRQLPPAAGGALLGTVIYLITFPRWGGAVRTSTVPHPSERSAGMAIFGVSVTASFGLATAAVYEGLRRWRETGAAAVSLPAPPPRDAAPAPDRPPSAPPGRPRAR